jgi:shikimate kinase
MNVYLIGYMGSGKSTVGRKLAARLGLQFADLDQWLEERAGISISEWFEQKGEADFRAKEQAALEELTKQSGLVVATGGGTACGDTNLSFMGKSGVVIYLEVEVPVLLSRLKPELLKRPLLAGRLEPELTEFISNHLEERKPYYLQAHLRVQATDLNAARLDDLAELIGALL